MSSIKPRIGEFIRDRRKAQGLDRVALSKAVPCSLDYIKKIEQGTTMPTVETLSAICRALNVTGPYRDKLFELRYPALRESEGPYALQQPTAEDMADIAQYPYPAAYIYLPSGDVVGVSPSTESVLPGLRAGSNLIEWLFNPHRPSSRVIPGWKDLAHTLAYGLRMMGPGNVPAERIAEIEQACSAHPDWDWLYKTDYQGQLVNRVTVIDTLEERTYNFAIRVDRAEVPRNPWLTYRFVPIPARTAFTAIAAESERVDLAALT